MAEISLPNGFIRQAALNAGQHTYAGRPCPGRHDGTRYASNGCCVECQSIYHKHAAKTPEERLYSVENSRRRRAEDRPRYLEIKRRCYAKNKERYLANARAYKKSHRAEMTAMQVRRHASQMKRTPKWGDLDAIETVYQRAAEMKRQTGIPYEVDHVIPLQGKTVSGLHVPLNLQILTEAENCKKRNHFYG